MAKLLEQAKENLIFVLMCVAIIAGLALIAKMAEKRLPELRKVTPATRVSIVGI